MQIVILFGWFFSQQAEPVKHQQKHNPWRPKLFREPQLNANHTGDLSTYQLPIVLASKCWSHWPQQRRELEGSLAKWSGLEGTGCRSLMLDYIDAGISTVYLGQLETLAWPDSSVRQVFNKGEKRIFPCTGILVIAGENSNHCFQTARHLSFL